MRGNLHRIWTPLFIVLIAVQFLLPGYSAIQDEETNSDSVFTQEEKVHFHTMLENPYKELNLSREEFNGKMTFDHFCAVCHGELGDGDGFNAYNIESSFQVKPFNFTDSTAVTGISLEEIKLTILEGGSTVGKSQYMPPWGDTLQPKEIREILKYIQTFNRRKN